MKHAWLVAALATTALLVPLRAQSPAPPAASPAYEVASVKPNTSGDFGIRIGVQPGGRFTVTNAPVRDLIRQAYNVQDFQLIGGPDWIKSDRFDIVAKASVDIPFGPPPPPGGPPSTQQLMLRALLADRFGLKVHNEPREMPIYALVIARADKKLGPKLTPSATDCAAMMAAMRAQGGPPQGPPRAGQPLPCGFMMGPGTISGGAFPLAQLAAALGNRMGRPVIDRTGLTGLWDIALTFTPDQMPRMPPGGLPPGAPPLPPLDPNGPSLQTALEEQLGLKLESTKGPVDVLVIDTVSQPTPD